MIVIVIPKVLETGQFERPDPVQSPIAGDLHWPHSSTYHHSHG